MAISRSHYAGLLVRMALRGTCARAECLCSSEQIQLQRLIARAGPDSSEQDARARIASQAPLSSKLPYADYVIDNSGDISELDKQVHNTVRKLKQQVWLPTWLACWLVPPFGLIKGLLTIVWRLYVKKVGQAKARKSRL